MPLFPYEDWAALTAESGTELLRDRRFAQEPVDEVVVGSLPRECFVAVRVEGVDEASVVLPHDAAAGTDDVHLSGRDGGERAVEVARNRQAVVLDAPCLVGERRACHRVAERA